MKKSLKKEPSKEDFFTDVLTELTYLFVSDSSKPNTRYSCPESII